MKTPLLLLLSLIVWGLTSSISANATSLSEPTTLFDQDSTATFLGAVYLKPDSTEAVANATVTLITNGHVVGHDLTGTMGLFLFEKLAYGQYTLIIHGSNIDNDTLGVTVDQPRIFLRTGVSSTSDSTMVMINGIPSLSLNTPEGTTVESKPNVSSSPPILSAATMQQLSTRNVTSVAATIAGVNQQQKNRRRGKRARRSRKSSNFSLKSYPDRLQRKEPVVEIDPGQLTAGVISDHNDWKTWKNVVRAALVQEARIWDLYPTRRYLVQVVNNERMPQVNAMVRLENRGGTVLWEARTDNTGRVELWYQLYAADSKAQEGLSVVVEHQGVSKTLNDFVPYSKGPNTVVLATSCSTFERVDIAWVVDATGSMDDEITYLQAELGDVIRRVQASRPQLEFEQASVFYKSEGDDYVTQKKAFTQDIEALQTFIDGQVADGGTSPEAVEAGLEVAINKLQWHDDATVKLLFLVLDEPPHDGPEVVEQMQTLIRQAAQKGIRIIPVAASGTDNKTEYLCRAIALATNGHYVFLTDDSGIGGAHKAPVASAYRVEFFNDLLVRLIEQATQPPLCEATLLPPLPETNPSEVPSSDKALEPLRIFPNPAIDRVQVVIPKGVKGILITDTNGRQLERWQNTLEGTRIWKVEHYPIGIYFLHYIQNGEQKTERLIVSKR